MGPQWEPPNDQVANLVMGGAVPERCVPQLVANFRSINMGRRDTPERWGRSWGRWAPSEWRRKPADYEKPEDPEQRIREGAAARERYKASVDRQRAKVRQKLTAGAKTSQRPADGEQPTIPKLLAGIGGNDD